LTKPEITFSNFNNYYTKYWIKYHFRPFKQ
jgi:hypothetical protein